jgi:nitrogen-specific signal transduction histidine kinase
LYIWDDWGTIIHEYRWKRLGLNIAEWIPNGHNGKIDVASELSQGFPFAVYVHARKA